MKILIIQIQSLVKIYERENRWSGNGKPEPGSEDASDLNRQFTSLNDLTHMAGRLRFWLL